MGQKVNPITFRTGVYLSSNANWYVDAKHYADTLAEDIKVRRLLEQKFAQAGISRIVIERPAKNLKIIIYVARTGVIIGKKGEIIEKTKNEISALTKVPVHINIEEIKKPDADAKLVAQNIAQQLEKRVMFRRAIKKAISSAQRQGAKGIKIMISGRIGGAEIARSEWMREGQVPLHTLRANIDYATREAKTTAGIIGVKVWIYKGELAAASNENAEGYK